MRTRLLAAVAAAAVTLANAKTDVRAPDPSAIPSLAASLVGRLAGKTLDAPDGSKVAIGSLADAARLEACFRTIGRASGWPASWLLISDRSKPYDLVLRIELAADGTIADPSTAFLTARRDWDDAAFDAAFKQATGSKPPRKRSLVFQSFTTKLKTSYVYDLPPTGPGAKGLLAMLPAGSLIREAESIDLRDGARHTISVVLDHPSFVPADCATEAGRKSGHRDDGGIVLVLAGEKSLEDKLDVTDVVKSASGAASLPRFTCEPGDTEPGAIDRLVEARFEGRTPVRLLDFTGHVAEAPLGDLPVVVGIKKDEKGAIRLYASPRGR